MHRTPHPTVSCGRRRLLRVLSMAAAAAGLSPRGQATGPQPGARGPQAATGWELVVLGITQDGGMPHPGCRRPPCSDVRAGRRVAEKVACLGLVDRGGTASYLFDATPDLPAQVHLLSGGRPPDAIFLTHAHMGHYAGLLYFGKEAWATGRVPVYGTRRMHEFLTANAPWNLLVTDGRIDCRVLEADRPVSLHPGVRVTSIPVPHRDELSDTVGFLIEGPRQRALYVPDTDRWETWSRPVRELVDTVDLAFLDGTFSSAEEVGGRDLAAIPHPLMPDTRRLLSGTRAQVRFIHLNHTNPALLDGKDVAREGMTFPI